jgi:OmpA-OmpF porin, OOP family
MYHRSKVPYFFLGLAAILAVAALVLLILRPESGSAPAPVDPVVLVEEEPVTPEPEPIVTLDEPPMVETPDEVLADLGIGVSSVDPAELVGRIGKALVDGDMAAVGRLVGKEALDMQTMERLKRMAMNDALRLREPEGFREVGELELNALARWALELEGFESGRDRIFLDLRRKDGKWFVERLTLPPGGDEPIPRAILADPLGVADAFLQAVLRQDFEFARGFVDQQQVSDAKIAGLCILFEEGEYRLRPSKPLRSLFRREDTVGFLANVQTKDGSQAAQFSMTLRQPTVASNWIVFEINLDQLLADYARRVGGGDLYYSPLVKNPQGGDTLALYFDFDEDAINPRTERQLQIVAQILLTDPGKKLTLSGHTDSLGTEAYNNQLSARRAAVVRDFLAASGVSPDQIVTLAKGASQPRRPNVTETGDDDPEARRVNRRTEIYLDF